MGRPPEYGTTVESTILIGDDEWTVIGSYHPETGVDIGEINGPDGVSLRERDLDKKDRDRAEQSLIDCYSHPDINDPDAAWSRTGWA